MDTIKKEPPSFSIFMFLLYVIEFLV